MLRRNSPLAGIRALAFLVPAVLPISDGKKRWRTLRDAIRGLPRPLGDYVEHPDWLHHQGWPGARQYPGHTPNDLDRPAKTVKAGVHGVPGGESVLREDDGTIRYMTVRETARVMTFPDGWRLEGPRGEQMRQLGNAVPVELARVMAESVHSVLDGIDTCP
jgi:DNA (cytosine-5)-methyltransferase 1